MPKSSLSKFQFYPVNLIFSILFNNVACINTGNHISLLNENGRLWEISKSPRIIALHPQVMREICRPVVGIHHKSRNALRIHPEQHNERIICWYIFDRAKIASRIRFVKEFSASIFNWFGVWICFTFKWIFLNSEFACKLNCQQYRIRRKGTK